MFADNRMVQIIPQCKYLPHSVDPQIMITIRPRTPRVSTTRILPPVPGSHLTRVGHPSEMPTSY